MAYDIRTSVQGMTTHPEGTQVDVKVTALKGVPMAFLELRARRAALVDYKPARNVDELNLSGLQRITQLDGEPIVRDAGTGKKRVLFTVIVRHD